MSHEDDEKVCDVCCNNHCALLCKLIYLRGKVIRTAVLGAPTDPNRISGFKAIMVMNISSPQLCQEQSFKAMKSTSRTYIDLVLVIFFHPHLTTVWGRISGHPHH